ncbi:hypothetical protein [Streptomyces flavofungini]|uniref:Uncharacterized protein n=1 Tax=Streptomyces flavofungini TaxID=68200 RepID=A0ABS0XAI9_9ACTN|nr:hypothetical protein [Streptomyces flavofungini]MBJ3810036.1 hypothetical protein [Streptomyces flavofungini]GHC53265.1 hypothetical protein GCM10010349_19220 [Streptomyces flavofungini]
MNSHDRERRADSVDALHTALVRHYEDHPGDIDSELRALYAAESAAADPPEPDTAPEAVVLLHPTGQSPAPTRAQVRPARRAWLAGLGMAAAMACVTVGWQARDLHSPSPAGSAAPGAVQPLSSPLKARWIAQLASVAHQEGEKHARRALAAIRESVPYAQLLDSSDFASLNPGYWVIYEPGPYRDGTRALRFCESVGRTQADDCVGRYLSHDRRDRDLVCLPQWPREPVGGCTREREQGR